MTRTKPTTATPRRFYGRTKLNAARLNSRKLMAKLGLDEQEPDTRPAQWGNPAMDGEAR